MAVAIPPTKNINIDSLQSDGKNPNKMNKKQHDALQKSIEKYGFIIPIITNSDLVIADGEQRWTVAKKMGLKEVPVISLPLKEVDRRIIRQVLNKLRGEHDQSLDLEEYKLIFAEGGQDDLKFLLAMQDKEFQFVTDYIRGLGTPAEADSVPESAPQRAKRGDLWALGRHRLYCGDSTDKSSVEAVMGQDLARMVFTDPPYNVDYGASKNPRHKIRSIENDSMDRSHWIEFCTAFINNLQLACPEGDLYVWGASGPEGMKQRLLLTELGAHWSATIIWNKDQLVLSPANYQRIYEPCFYGWFKKSSFNGVRTETEVWNMARPKDSKLHPTMKPIELCERAIKNSSVENDIVLDLFLGSGSTLIAAERTNRRCYGLELTPEYCDVILKRWEDLTGQEAKKIL